MKIFAGVHTIANYNQLAHFQAQVGVCEGYTVNGMVGPYIYNTKLKICALAGNLHY